MPELPEVETIVRALAPRVSGRQIRSAEFLSKLVLRHTSADIAERLAGRTIRRLERRGKFIVMPLDRGMLTVHLGMTGKLLLDAQRTPYTRAILALDDATLLYDDIRQFGSIQLDEDIPERVGRLGPEPFEITATELHDALSGRRAPVKALLLNQAIVRGLGNIYVDEALFRAGIHPRSRRVSRPRAARLHAAIIEVLQEAIDHRGSSVSDYVDVEGRRGAFQDRHLVYRKESLPCVNCGRPIKRIVVAQRGTHYCPNCQK